MEIKVKERTEVKSPIVLNELLKNTLATESEIDRDKEHFWVIGLTSNNTLKYLELVSLGTLDSSLVHPREVFRFAITKGVKAIVLAHNHPSGCTQASQEDIELTKRLEEAGRIVGIKLLDHIIVTEQDGYFSFQERGLL